LPVLAIKGTTHFFRDEVEEGRWVHLERAPIEGAAIRIRQDEPRAGPGHPHVKKAAFLGQVLITEEETGEEPVLAPGDEYHLPFEAFGGMKGHEGEPLACQKRMINAPLDGKGIQECLQIALTSNGQVPQTGECPVGLIGINGNAKEFNGIFQDICDPGIPCRRFGSLFFEDMAPSGPELVPGMGIVRDIRVAEDLEVAPEEVHRISGYERRFSGPDKRDARPVQGLFEGVSLGVKSVEDADVSKSQQALPLVRGHPAAVHGKVGGPPHQPLYLFHDHLRFFGFGAAVGQSDGASS
jgi:hypothetical protein